jgi:hypothetical protein
MNDDLVNKLIIPYSDSSKRAESPSNFKNHKNRGYSIYAADPKYSIIDNK